MRDAEDFFSKQTSEMNGISFSSHRINVASVKWDEGNSDRGRCFLLKLHSVINICGNMQLVGSCFFFSSLRPFFSSCFFHYFFLFFIIHKWVFETSLYYGQNTDWRKRTQEENRWWKCGKHGRFICAKTVICMPQLKCRNSIEAPRLPNAHYSNFLFELID